MKTAPWQVGAIYHTLSRHDLASLLGENLPESPPSLFLSVCSHLPKWSQILSVPLFLQHLMPLPLPLQLEGLLGT